MPKKFECVGEKFNRLSVIAESEIKKYGRRFVVCLCDCGNKREVDPRDLFTGHTKSCGCLQKEIMAEICKTRAKHGASRTTEYYSWQHMKRRCLNPNNIKYKDYGGRGITVCDRWMHSFNNFIRDMGKKPTSAHSIDRIDNNGNYEPSNCRWATHKEQANNKRRHVTTAIAEGEE